MAGYAKAWRKRWEHPVFLNKQEAAVWAWMTDSACYKEYRFRTAHGIVELQRGQLLISERRLAEDFGLSRHRLRALIGALEHEGMIALNSDHSAKKSGTIVTIQNYDKWQGVTGDGDDDDNQSSTKEPTSGQPVANQSSTKREEDKENKEGKETNYAFAGRIIRLTPDDFETWRKTYYGIPDLRAELTALDAHYDATLTGKNRRNWYVRCSTALKNKHQEYLARQRDGPTLRAVGGV